MKRVLCLALLLLPLFLSGCILNTILDDVVNGAPRAVVDASPSEGAAPLYVSLDAHYSHDDGTIVEYRWDFGDPGETGSKLGSACTHTYDSPGTYLVKLTVTDNEGSIDSQQVAIVVTNAPPVAAASVSNATPYPADEVVFDASQSYDLNGSIVNYLWVFGDDATAEGQTVTHSYAEGGEYVVTLIVTDDEGDTGRDKLSITVQTGTSNCSGSTCGGSTTTPLAVIAGLPTCSGGTAGVPVTLDGTSSQAAVGKIVSYRWNFGDGSTGSGSIVSHTYTAGGRYLVSLTVTDEGGGVGTSYGNCSIGSATCGGG